MATRRTAILLAILLAAAFIHPAQAQVFSDGFEDGTFDAWTGTIGSPTIVEDPTHHGSNYAAEMNAAELFYYTWGTGPSEFYARFYFRLESATSDGDAFRILRDDVPRIALRIVNSGGTKYWAIAYTNSGWSWTPETSGTTMTSETWYCVEMWWKANTAGGMKLWIDGDLVHTAAGTTLSTTLATLQFRLETESGSYPTCQYDCCVIDTAYIGPEEEGQDLTFTQVGNLLLHDSAATGRDLARTYGPVLHLYAAGLMNKEAGFQLTGTLALWAAATLGREWGFTLGGVLHLWDSHTMTTELAAGVEHFFTLLATLRLHATALPTLEVRTPVEHAFNLYDGIHLHDSHTIAKELGYVATATIRLWDSTAMTTQGVAQDLTFLLTDTLHLIGTAAATMETAALILDAASIAGLALLIALVAVALIMARRRND